MRYLLLVLLLNLSMPAHSQVYKWVDSNGSVQYSDQPPAASVASEAKLNINSKPLPSTETAPSSTTQKELQEFKGRRDSAQEEAAIKQMEIEENNKRCADAQSRLKMFQEMPRISLPDGKGSFRGTTEDEHRELIAEEKVNISTYCKH